MWTAISAGTFPARPGTRGKPPGPVAITSAEQLQHPRLVTTSYPSPRDVTCVTVVDACTGALIDRA